MKNIYNFVKSYTNKKDYESLNNFIEELNIDRLNTCELIAYLKYTAKLKKQLPAREKLLGIVKQEIEERGEDFGSAMKNL